MKLKQIHEARYHGEHPFIADFFRNFLDADALSKTRYPKEIEFDTWVEALTSRYGKPINGTARPGMGNTGYLEWEVKLPSHLVDKYDMNMAYVYLQKKDNLIEVVWE